ncbi:hypothetical protein MACK_002679 [Theileria orientalis]|uniref:Cell division control protein 73 C-terminal domain-containing protein n=1 Tax=Theileria orientalis TaxID=68886 RepID=A0A976QTU2_THEOR|nr:hypothetical protein MACK_002679 [Theileria orientalis]
MDTNELSFEDSWDFKSDPAVVDSFWKNAETTESVLLLKAIVLNNYKLQFVKNSADILVVRMPDFNMELNVFAPSGLTSRRGESYVIGDILLFTQIKREEYTYSSVTKRGFKYINVLERDRIKSIMEESKVSPELLDFKVQYMAIEGGEVKIPGKSLEGPSKLVSAKLSVKRILEKLYGDLVTLQEKYESVNEADTNSENDEKVVKKAKHDYINNLVFVTCIQERPVRTRNSLLTAHGEGFEKILQKADVPDGSKKLLKPHGPTVTGLITKSQKLKVIDEICYKYRKRPIIIVPSGTVSIISRQNIKQMLQEHQFIDANESIRTYGSIVSNLPMNGVEIVHTIGKKQIKFRVIENSYISRFTQSDWISVVCVVLNVKGEKWQFNGYPFESFIDLFLTLKGVLFVHDGDMVPSEMGSWDIKVLRISRSHRHNDASIAKEFWQYIENFLLQPRQRKISQTKKLSQ